MTTTKQIASTLSGSILSLFLFVTLAGQAAQNVEVSTGYNDEPRNGTPYSAGSGQPIPWNGSANTTFYGAVGVANAYDPDENAILLQNLGGSPISLTAATMGSYDLFALDSIGGPVTLAPGQNVILAGVDGSEAFSSLQTVGLTLAGTAYNYSDVATTDAPGGVLLGANPFIGNAETIPWTPIYTPRFSTGVPDSGPGLAMMAATLFGVCGLSRKFRSQFVAELV